MPEDEADNETSKVQTPAENPDAVQDAYAALTYDDQPDETLRHLTKRDLETHGIELSRPGEGYEARNHLWSVDFRSCLTVAHVQEPQWISVSSTAVTSSGIGSTPPRMRMTVSPRLDVVEDHATKLGHVSF